jgi:hypothetical protein
MAITDKRRYEKRKSEGRCVACGKPRSIHETTIKCSDCRRRHKEASLKYIYRHKGKDCCQRCGSAHLITQPEGAKWRFCEECFLKKLSRTHLGTEKEWKFLKELFESQNGCCYYTGERLTLGINASIDHKLPQKRFPAVKHSPDNVCWSTLEVNLMKRDLTDTEFINLCAQVTRVTQCR